MRKFILVASAIATLIPAVPAAAAGQYDYRRDRSDNYQNDRNQEQYYRDQSRYGDQRGRQANRYDRYNTRYAQNSQTWRGNDGRYYCRRSDGTTGTVVGAIGGGVLGGAIGGNALGAVLGAGAGALLGRSVDRGSTNCR